jgi:Fe2+ transport system protein FeoA
VQSGVFAGEKLERAVAAVRCTIVAIEQLDASITKLRELGLVEGAARYEMLGSNCVAHCRT